MPFNRIPEIVERARQLKVNGGLEPNTDIGPLITKEVVNLLPQ